MKTTFFTSTQLKEFILATIILIASSLIVSNINAQQLAINERSHLVMNGNAFLVINNAGFLNNGNFKAGNGTAIFTGHVDTTIAKLSGNDTTTFNNLTINKTANGIALRSGANVNNTLTVIGGILYTDSNLTLKSTFALTARVAPVAIGSNIIGKTNVERFIPTRRAWRLMTAPLTNANSIYKTWQNNGVFDFAKGTFVTGPNAANANGLDVSPQNNTSMRTWNSTTQSFNNVTNTNVSISAGTNGTADNTGYLIFVRGDRNPNNYSTSVSNITTLTSTGRLQVGDQNFNVSNKSAAMTLIGNPYASAVDFNKLPKTNVINRFYVWDATINALGGYVMIDDLSFTGVFNKSVNASKQTQDIQSGQAFFVQTIHNAPASITFKENCKSTENSSLMFRPATPNNFPSQFFRTNLYIVNTDSSLILADGTFAEFNTQFSDSVLLEDAPKFGNVNENLALVRNNNALSAERRPIVSVTDTLNIRTWKTGQKTYQFEFIPTNMQVTEIILQDSYLKTNTNLNLIATTKINFKIDANAGSAAMDRFKIIFKNAIVLPVTIKSVKATQQNNNIAVEWKVENEINILQYEVEKSTTGQEFIKMYAVNVNGNNNAYNTYNWLDVKAAQGNNFYRIKSIGINGEVKYSAIVKIALSNSSKSSMSIYPNPVTNNIINLQLVNQAKGTYQLRLTNNIGQTIYTTSMQSSSLNTTLSINVPGKLASGIYNLEINAPNNTKSTQTVIVQ